MAARITIPLKAAAAIAVAASLVLCVPAGTGAQATGSALAIVGATIIDGNGGPPLVNGSLLIEGDRITAVGASGAVTVPDGARVIDGTGRYVTPGFIDSNVHLSLYGSGPADRYLSLHETIVRYAPRNAALALEAAQMQLKHGFTTVRDSYGSLLPLMRVRDAVARGDTVGPRMLVAGNIVGWGGPYSVSFSLTRQEGLTLFQEQFNDFITQGSGEEWMEMELADLRDAVNRYLDLGPDFIKYGGTGHFSNPVMIGFSPEAQRVLVEETPQTRADRRDPLNLGRGTVAFGSRRTRPDSAPGGADRRDAGRAGCRDRRAGDRLRDDLEHDCGACVATAPRRTRAGRGRNVGQSRCPPPHRTGEDLGRVAGRAASVGRAP